MRRNPADPNARQRAAFCLLGGLFAIATATACSDGNARTSSESAVSVARARVQVIDDALTLARAYPVVEREDGSGYLVFPSATREQARESLSNRSTGPRWVLPSPMREVQLPPSADGVMRLPASGGVRISIRRANALPSPGHLSRGVLAYTSAVDGLDALVFATERGIEDLWTVHAPRERWGYELELPQGWRVQAASSVEGLAEVRDDRDVARLRMWARAAWDATGAVVPVRVSTEADRVWLSLPESVTYPVIVDPEWTATDTMVYAREAPTLTPLANGRVLVTGGESSAPGAAELFDPISSSFTTTSDAPSQQRVGGWAFRMGASQVLLVGGRSPGGGAVKECELYNVEQDAFQIGPQLVQPRQAQTVVQLRGGDVLVAGGYENDGLTHVTFAELIDSTALGKASTMSSRSGDLVEGQAFTSGLLLPSGKALLTGGDRSGPPASDHSELFNPDAGSFTQGYALLSPRKSHQSLLRPDGKVLLLGGLGTQSERLPELELFDPETGDSKPASTMIAPRATGFSTIALADGSILIIGGDTASGAPLSETELHFPEQRAALPGPRLHAARRDHGSALLPDGRVLVAGSSTSSASSTAELLNPNALYPEAMKTLQWPRTQHTATRLSSGEVLIVGGEDVLPVDLFDPTTDEFRAGGRLDGARSGHTATPLSTGQVLVVGGAGTKQSVDLYDPLTQTFSSLAPLNFGRSQHTATPLDDDHVLITGGCSSTLVEVIEISSNSVEFAGSLSAARYGHAAMLLADGRVLIAGGSGSSAEIFDPSSYKTKPVPMNVSRANAQLIRIPSGAVVIGGSNVVEHFDLATEQFKFTTELSFHNGQGSSATLLESGEILVAGGGWYGYWEGLGDRNAQAELYDPQTETVALLGGTMMHGRVGHTATLLDDGTGRVLLTGGAPGDYGIPGVVLATAELYDPDTQTFSKVELDETVLSGQSAVLLPTGRVLIAGGHPGGAKDAVLRNQDGTIVSTGEMTERRTQHAATALRHGTVLVTGGHNYQTLALNTAELYDEALDGFRAVSNMTHARNKHTATLLPNGRVLLAGGTESNEAELYDPATDHMLEAGTMVRQRYEHGAAVLSNGLVLIAGGVDVDGNDVEDAELYDPGSLTFRALDVATGIGGPTRVSVDMAGNVFLAGRGRGAVLDERLELVSTLSGLPDRPTTIVPFLWGGITICGAWEKNQSTSCHEASTLGLDAAPSVLVPGIGGTTTRLASGDLLVRSLSAEEAAISAVFRIAPPNAIRPTVNDPPSTIRIGEEGVLTGTRFTSPPTPGAEAQHDFPDILPWLVFVPNAGAPVLFPLKDWTDTRLQFEAASTAWHGPGWLHVMVQGVPSEGRYIVLKPKLDGAACKIDAACEHGSCVEGVCCNDRCEDPCWSCRAAHNGGTTDGECLPIGEGNDPKDACMESMCGLTGVCDGQGQCARIEELSTCATGRICREGSCEPTLGEDCTSTLDCAEGQACGEDRTCVVETPSPVVVDGGCSLGGPSPRGSSWLAWVTVALVLSRRRRRAGCRVLDETQP